VLLGVFLTLLSITAFTVRESDDFTDANVLSRFANKAELAEFLMKDGAIPGDEAYSPSPEWANDVRVDLGAGVPYSQTNVQVTGVDEDDFVKTDGECIYVASGDAVSILRAYPAQDMQEIASISMADLLGGANSTYIYSNGIFVSGDRLVVIASIYVSYSWTDGYAQDASTVMVDCTRTMVAVFDVSDPTLPELDFSVGISGYVLTCRMIEDTVYAITQANAMYSDEKVIVPTIYSATESSEVEVSTIRYDPETPQATSYVNILAVDLNDGDYSSLSVLAGWASTIYASSDSLYLTVQKWTGPVIMIDDELTPEEPDKATTSIYRIVLDRTRMSPAAKGEVTGWLLNQFSMDEHESFLRVATTTDWANPENAIYVLDDALDVVGSLEGLAPDERIYSARFLGDKLYLVTFRQMDPLFVIDLTSPKEPEVIGMLEVPGFSTYLHPIDDTHVLGIGQENWTVKISLYDVSDPSSPVEQSKYLLEDSSWSLALYDHKAVLYDADRELLVIPGYTQGNDYYTYYAVPSAFVFEVSVSEGISLRGIITHELDDSWGSGYIERALYIGECLYTVSRHAVQANMLDDLTYVKLVEFADTSYYSR